MGSELPNELFVRCVLFQLPQAATEKSAEPAPALPSVVGNVCGRDGFGQIILVGERLAQNERVIHSIGSLIAQDDRILQDFAQPGFVAVLDPVQNVDIAGDTDELDLVAALCNSGIVSADNFCVVMAADNVDDALALQDVLDKGLRGVTVVRAGVAFVDDLGVRECSKDSLSEAVVTVLRPGRR